ncbi:MAG: sodium:solute symporter, partial [Phycisphaerales bacterium]
MRLAAVDWTIVAAFMTALAWSAGGMRRHATSVSGFLSANRLAGRYLLTVSYNMAQVGVITLVWYFQLGYDVGFTQYWWGYLEGPALILLAATGWVIYRFRETRAMTLAQFFEMRYSRRLRIFGGLVAFVSGILNYAIFPGVTARFFIAMLGLPDGFELWGAHVETFPVVMAALLSFAVFMVFAGGMLAVLVTDFFQGVFCFCTFVTVCWWVMLRFPWLELEETMLMLPAGKSMLNPLGLSDERNFNVVYWLISAFTLFYACRAWQGDQGYNSAARDAHEARMGQLLNGWRYRTLMLVTVLVPLAVRAFLTHPEHAAASAGLQEMIAAQPTEALQAEMRVPLALGVMLPAGMLGLVVAAMLGAAVSTDEAYLHSWGSIFVQDVVLPFRRRPMSPRSQLVLLKLAVLGVAVFAFLFSLRWQPGEYIAMYGALTGSIFVAGGGAAIIGGLYTRWGTAAGHGDADPRAGRGVQLGARQRHRHGTELRRHDGQLRRLRGGEPGRRRPAVRARPHAAPWPLAHGGRPRARRGAADVPGKDRLRPPVPRVGPVRRGDHAGVAACLHGALPGGDAVAPLEARRGRAGERPGMVGVVARVDVVHPRRKHRGDGVVLDRRHPRLRAAATRPAHVPARRCRRRA